MNNSFEKEEKEPLDSYEKGEWKPTGRFKR